MTDLPQFPVDVAAFTCRLRSTVERSTGVLRWQTVFAPAGGLGWSQPCCAPGHSDQDSASAHGGVQLSRLLNPHATVSA